MSISSTPRNDTAAGGLIGYLGLSDWWFGSFTDDERSTIRQTYTPFGGCHFDDGDVQFSQFTPLSFLTGLAAWFAKEHLRSIAYRVLGKASTYLRSANEPLDVHFFCQSQIEICYRDRHTQKGLARAISACREQIAYATTAAAAFKREYPTLPLPGHKGYTQLAIILEKQQRYSEAVHLCSDAKKSGWCGDWDARIARCNKKLNSA
jgi:hypothetical protein